MKDNLEVFTATDLSSHKKSIFLHYLEGQMVLAECVDHCEEGFLDISFDIIWYLNEVMQRDVEQDISRK